MNCRIYYVFMVCILLTTQTNWTGATTSIWSWIWPNRNVFITNHDEFTESNYPPIQFEFDENVDWFILESSKMIGIDLSQSDMCQQRAIFALKQSCGSLSDEDLSKFAVVMLNCQLATENRRTIDCSELTPLKECVKEMSTELYNAYTNLYSMSRNICITVRQTHFRGLAEITINKLMKSARDQLSLINTFKEKNEEMQRSAMMTFDEIAESHSQLVQKNEELKNILGSHQVQTAENIEQILKEREIIESGSKELNEFLTSLKLIYDKSLSISESHTEYTGQLFEAVINDLNNLRELMNDISDDMSAISKITKEHQQIIHERFAETMSELDKSNAIINDFSKSILVVQNELNRIKTTLEFILGENCIEKLIIFTTHALYILVGMLFLVFVNANKISRITFVVIVGINLAAVLTKIIEMQFFTLLATNLALLLVQYFVYLSSKFNLLQYFVVSKKEENNNVTISKQKNAYANTIHSSDTDPANNRNQYETTHNSYTVSQPTYRKSLSSLLDTDRKTRSRNRSIESTVIDADKRSDPSRRSVSFFDESIVTPSRCHATTIRGTKCRNPVCEGSSTELCSIHERSEKSRDR